MRVYTYRCCSPLLHTLNAPANLKYERKIRCPVVYFTHIHTRKSTNEKQEQKKNVYNKFQRERHFLCFCSRRQYFITSDTHIQRSSQNKKQQQQKKSVKENFFFLSLVLFLLENTCQMKIHPKVR